jgi:hypothetical protein
MPFESCWPWSATYTCSVMAAANSPRSQSAAPVFAISHCLSRTPAHGARSPGILTVAWTAARRCSTASRSGGTRARPSRPRQRSAELPQIRTTGNAVRRSQWANQARTSMILTGSSRSRTRVRRATPLVCCGPSRMRMPIVVMARTRDRRQPGVRANRRRQGGLARSALPCPDYLGRTRLGMIHSQRRLPFFF